MKTMGIFSLTFLDRIGVKIRKTTSLDVKNDTNKSKINSSP
jgi:hypothetical protein